MFDSALVLIMSLNFFNVSNCYMFVGSNNTISKEAFKIRFCTKKTGFLKLRISWCILYIYLDVFYELGSFILNKLLSRIFNMFCKLLFSKMFYLFLINIIIILFGHSLSVKVIQGILGMRSENTEIRTRKNSVFGHFSRSEIIYEEPRETSLAL